MIRVRPESGQRSPSSSAQASPGWGVLEWFIVAQTAIPALLFIPGTQVVRLPLRIAPFVLSLIPLVWAILRPGSGAAVSPHPARLWLLLAIALLGVMIFAPTTNSLLAGMAQVMLYFSVFAPVLWVPRLVGSSERLQRLLVIMLVCNGINAVVGVLQVYDPARWMPEELSQLVVTTPNALASVSYIGPNGVRIIRPSGLFDNPGAVCGPGMVAALLGAIFFVSPIGFWRKVAAMLLGLAGLAAIYLSQVRTAFMILIGMAAVYLLTLLLQKRRAAAVVFVATFGGIAVVALSLAVALAGDSVSERLASLFAPDPLSVYYASGRGDQLLEAFTEFLVEHPIGAGLGRWGMVHSYFGDPSNRQSPSIWVELQPNALIIDGGILLLAFYAMALLVTSVREFHIVKSGMSPALKLWGGAILALNLGTVALAFGFTPFTTQVGLQYWFLAGLLHGAAEADRTTVDAHVRPG